MATAQPAGPRRVAGFFLAVHGGAGWHDPTKEAAFLAALRRSCAEGARALQEGQEPSALGAACAATAVLEDEGVFNAGLGSNLTEEGVVECDAAAMDADGFSGAVAAVPGVRNPIRLAQRLLEDSRAGVLSFGRVPPVLMVGDPARRFALARGLEAAATPQEAAGWLVTPAQRARWEKVRASIDSGSGAVRASPAGDWAGGTDRGAGAGARGSDPAAKRHRGPEADAAGDGAGGSCGESNLSDTVGAVCVCLFSDGTVDCAAAVSSGGTLFKFAGRVGDAAVPGCGCYARAAPVLSPSSPDREVACTSVTGVGEHAIRAEMGGRCGRAMLAAHSAAGAEAALAEASTQFVGPRDIGVLALWARRKEATTGAAPALEVEFGAPWAARSFAIGHVRGGDAAELPSSSPSAVMSVQILRNEAGLGGSSVGTFCVRCIVGGGRLEAAE